MITTLPTAPTVADSTADFNSKAFALIQALNAFVSDANTLGANIDADVAASTANALLAVNSAAAAVGASNFKGEWSTLSGALNIPAAVSYNGGVWVLKANLSNVATAVPGVSGSWLSATFSTGKAIAMSA